MNLILFKRSEVSEDGKTIQLVDKDPRTKHIFGHLRKVDGDSVTIGIISGKQGKAILRTTGSNGNRLELPSSQNGNPSSSLLASVDVSQQHEIVLVISLPFPKRLKGLWAQITSMSVTRICIIRGMLSDPNFRNSSTITPEVYQPLVEEGMSQGCHTKEVTVDVEVDDIVSQATLEKLHIAKTKTKNCELSGYDDIYVFLDCGDETTEPLPCRKVIMNHVQRSPKGASSRKRVVLAVGSERGWTDDEAKIFHEAGYKSASLGRSILRVDTAIVVGLGIVSATLDEIDIDRGNEPVDHEGKEGSAKKRKEII